MFPQASMTNSWSSDYLSTLIQNKLSHHNYNPNIKSYQNDQQQIQSDFTPFMKRHSSSGDSYIRDNNQFADRVQKDKELNELEQDSFMMDRLNLFSKRYELENEVDKETKEDTKFDDSFLQLVEEHLSHIQKDKQNLNHSNLQTTRNPTYQSISLSKPQITHSLLQNQSLNDSIQLTNLLSTRSIAKIINSPFQFRLLNAKNKFIKKDEVEILLQPYETVEIEFEIRRREGQIGNIYETMNIETVEGTGNNTSNDKKVVQVQKKYLKFQITYVKPKLQITFLGRTIVKRIHQHKIAYFQLYPNQLNQYLINLIFSQQQFSTLNSSKLQRIECQIQTKGYVSVHPSSVILYQNEPLKIVVRKLSQLSGTGKTSVIVIKPLHSSLVYVMGVRCMEKTLEQREDVEGLKMGKYEF